jgi:hypothetical protein
MSEIKRMYKIHLNRVDTKIGSVTAQAGILEGIENINTPTHSSLSYTSFYYQKMNGFR